MQKKSIPCSKTDSKNVTIYATNKNLVLVICDPFERSTYGNVDNLSPCSHTEADTRIFLHLKDAVDNGYRTATVKSFDM